MKLIFAVSLLLVISGLSAAQATSPNLAPTDTINLTGAWSLDLKASNFGDAKAHLIYDSLTLVISHQGPVLKISRQMARKKKTTTQELTYYTDGRGESNPTASEGKLESKTSWWDKLIIIKGTSETPMGGDVVISDVTEKWELSDSGNTLIEYTVTGPFHNKFRNLPPFGGDKVTKVFRRRG